MTIQSGVAYTCQHISAPKMTLFKSLEWTNEIAMKRDSSPKNWQFYHNLLTLSSKSHMSVFGGTQIIIYWIVMFNIGDLLWKALFPYLFHWMMKVRHTNKVCKDDQKKIDSSVFTFLWIFTHLKIKVLEKCNSGIVCLDTYFSVSYYQF